MTVVSNTSPLIALSLIDRFSIIFDLFQTISKNKKEPQAYSLWLFLLQNNFIH